MTNAPIPPSPVAFWLAQVDQQGMEQGIEDASKELAKAFAVKFKYRREALHLRKKDPAGRLAEYEGRTQEAWSEMRNVFPKDYQEQTADWHLLQMKVLRGEMAPPAPPPPAPPSPLAPSVPPYGIQEEAQGLKAPVIAQREVRALYPRAS